MKKLCLSIAFALVVGVTLSAQGVAPRPTSPQTGPDLSGRWTREAASGADSAGWGPQVEIKQAGVEVTAQPSSGKPQRLRLDGQETTEVAAVEGCKVLVRVTKSQTDRDRVTITTWLATTGSAACYHGKADCDALEKLLLEIANGTVRGSRKLESITVVSRQGDAMTVDTTRSNPGDVPTSTTSTYRK